jgi:hypothetical protein
MQVTPLIQFGPISNFIYKELKKQINKGYLKFA